MGIVMKNTEFLLVPCKVVIEVNAVCLCLINRLWDKITVYM
jgi:hypothetical protein